jgi:DNA anti-recombination protein RmuC
MAEEIKDVNKKIDEMDAAVKKYASKDTVISIGGYEFTPAKLMVAFTIISSTLGGLYGAFEVYKDYQSMKKKIAEYVTPDLTEINKKLELVQQNSEKGTQYTQDIKTDLKQDIRRLESVVENVERSNRQIQRETMDGINAANREMKQTQKEINDSMKTSERAINETIKSSERAITQVQRDMDNQFRNVRKEVDDKIKKALDNPLAK